MKYTRANHGYSIHTLIGYEWNIHDIPVYYRKEYQAISRIDIPVDTKPICIGKRMSGLSDSCDRECTETYLIVQDGVMYFADFTVKHIARGRLKHANVYYHSFRTMDGMKVDNKRLRCIEINWDADYPEMKDKKRPPVITRIVGDKEKYDVWVGVGSPWECPFRIPQHGDRHTVMKRYKLWLKKCGVDIGVLKGKVLGCCAADVDIYMAIAEILNDDVGVVVDENEKWGQRKGKLIGWLESISYVVNGNNKYSVIVDDVMKRWNESKTPTCPTICIKCGDVVHDGWIYSVDKVCDLCGRRGVYSAVALSEEIRHGERRV